MSRREIGLVILLLSAAVALRCVHSGGMAVEHFDEGVYASNSWFGAEQQYQYPLRYLYAPSLLPALMEFSLLFDRMAVGFDRPPHRFAPLIPSLVAGCATVLFAWRMARAWFGVRAGLVTAALIAGSDFHVLYSRTGLTDVLLACWLLLAVWLGERGVRSGRPLPLAGAGLAAGLAWWTKYNGWLPLVILFAGTLLTACRPDARPRLTRRLARCTVIAAVALLVWSPYLAGLQTHGGYQSVATNHAQYFVGPAGWVASSARQAANLAHLDSWLGVAAFLLAGMTLLVRWPDRRARGEGAEADAARGSLPGVLGATVLAGGLVASCGSALALILFACLGLVAPPGDTANDRPDPGGEAASDGLRTALVGVWFFGLLISTGLYHPYPRLNVVWLLAAWIAAGHGLVRLSRMLSRGETEASLEANIRRARTPAAILAGTVLLVLFVPARLGRPVPAWQDRSALAEASEQLLAETRQQVARSQAPDREVVLYVLGELAVFYHFRAAGHPYAFPVEGLGFVDAPVDPRTAVFLVTGPHAERMPEFRRQRIRLADRIRLIREAPYRASDLVLLNHFAPRDLHKADLRIRLYQVKPPSSMGPRSLLGGRVPPHPRKT